MDSVIWSFLCKDVQSEIQSVVFYSNFSWAFGVFILPFFGFVFDRIVTFLKQNKGKEVFQNILKNKYFNLDFVIGFWLFLFYF
ncbi:hypothetical protein LEP1GSC150_1882 [Leptospira interrogans serovar Copenhageni str. LT2050]|uniref:Uncharacterized protein n=1 Tax=Leptospira interrogans serovar Copenhageni str. LT2050 TaxID=1001598 RepID=M3HAH4_LEPIT|nr:hypothetical protein LEP1GSC150_1882 [Leptospira interrogans serovar Copenhageni str. LT2050]